MRAFVTVTDPGWYDFLGAASVLLAALNRHPKALADVLLLAKSSARGAGGLSQVAHSTDWPAWITAVGTLLLFGGVVFAAAQFLLERRNARVVETGTLLNLWNAETLRDTRRFLERWPDIGKNRQRATRLYHAFKARKRLPRFRQWNGAAEKFIEETSQLAERMEIYIRKGAADMSIIGDHLSWDIISTYYYLQDILAERAKQEEYNYEGFRNLALRCQKYSKAHPDEADVADELTLATLSALPVITWC